MSKKTTIYDIARYLHISPASVSYVINGVDKVSEETKKKVKDAIIELGYSRDTIAVSLSKGKSNLIALVLPWEDLSKAFLENPFYGEFLGSLAKRIQRKGYDLLIEPLKEEKDFVTWAKAHAICGIVTIGKFPKGYYNLIKSLEIPAVLVDVFENYATEFTTLRINDSDGTYMATEYLIKNGHKDIAFLGGDVETSEVDNRRLVGYKAALKDYELPYRDEYVFTSQVTIDGGFKISEEIMKNKNISALVCAADILAIGVMKGYLQAKKTIPEDLSIIGFDDIQSAQLVYPGLTTVKQDISEKGRLTAKLILDLLLEKTSEVKHLVLQPSLVERDSVFKIG